MKTIDNEDSFVVEDLQETLCKGSSLYWIGNSFSLHLFEALKPQLEKCHSLKFIFMAKVKILEEEEEALARPQPLNLLTKRGLIIDCLRWIQAKGQFKVNPGLQGQEESLWIRTNHQLVVYTAETGFMASPAAILRQKLPWEEIYLTYFQKLWTDSRHTEEATEEVMERIMKLW